MTVSSVPSGPNSLWNVAASNATAKQINVNSGQSVQKLVPTSDMPRGLDRRIRSMTRAATTE